MSISLCASHGDPLTSQLNRAAGSLNQVARAGQAAKVCVRFVRRQLRPVVVFVVRHVAHERRAVLADGDGRLRQHRPEARACQGSLLGSLLRICSPHGPRKGSEEEGAGRQETKKKTLLQVARGTHKHQRTGFLMAMLLLLAMPMRSALTPQLGAQLDPGARNMTDI